MRWLCPPLAVQVVDNLTPNYYLGIDVQAARTAADAYVIITQTDLCCGTDIQERDTTATHGVEQNTTRVTMSAFTQGTAR